MSTAISNLAAFRIPPQNEKDMDRTMGRAKAGGPIGPRLRGLATAAGVLALGLALAGAVPVAASPSSFSWSGRCTDGTLFVRVDPDRLRSKVPSGYDLVLQEGAAVLLIGVAECTNTKINDTAIGSYRASEGITFVHRKKSGQPGLYVLWQVTNNALLQSRWTGLDVDGDLTDIAFSSATDAVSKTVKADVNWSQSPHSVTVRGFGPPVPVDSQQGGACDYRAGIGWHEGRHGTVDVNFVVTDPDLSPEYGEQAGTGEVNAAAGTPLADILGSTSATGDGAVRHFNFTGCAGLID